MGYQRPIELGDIWLVNPKRSAEVLHTKLYASYERRTKAGEENPLVGAIYDTFKREIWIGAVCQFFAACLQVFSPFTLKYLIAFANEAYSARVLGTPAPSIGRGLGLVFGITIMQMVQSLGTNHFIYRGMMVGGEARATMISIIFDKALRISGRAKAGGKPPNAPPPEIKPGTEAEKKWYKKMLKGKKDKKDKKDKKGPGGAKGVAGDGQGWSNGRIVNLMSTDTYRIDQAFGMFHMVWSSPLIIILTLILLLVNLTYSALSGFGLIVIIMPLLARSIRSLFKRRMAINKITDQRVGLTQEILQAVRFVKYFGWETSFLDRISAIRRREIGSIQKLLAIRNAINAVGMSLPVFASMLSFITFYLSNHALNPAPIFSSLALFNALRLPLNFLPLVLGQVIDGYSSVKRIEEFMSAEDAEESTEWDYNNANAIAVKNAEFTWERTPTQDPDNIPGKNPRSNKQIKADNKAEKKAEKDAEKEAKKHAGEDEKERPGSGVDSASTLTEKAPFKLQDINFEVGRNELIAVIGTVGSGKSSLLAALAGDMRKTAGEVMLGATRAFCPQYAWIQNATVKENIIFGKEFDKKWYNEVVDACALRADFEMLPHADQTEIGERGITVSGGQKQRLNIARAIYFNSDIVLMDDPLSAVDAHVGRHIMDNAICGLLKDKCRVLATHQLWVLNRCDRIVWMEDGHIQAIDTFDNLMANNEDFGNLMASTAVEKKKTTEEEDEEEDEDEVEADKKVAKKRKGKKPAAALMQVEERAVAGVSWGVYSAYLKAAGGIYVAPLVLLLLIMSQGANIVTSLWLSWWTSKKWPQYPEGLYVSARSSTSPYGC